jgi:hypothetical protein
VFPSVTATMSLANLPTELVLMVDEYLPAKRDKNALIRTSRRFMLLLDNKLYKDNSPMEHTQIMLWAAEREGTATIHKCISAGAKFRRRDRFRSYTRPLDSPEELTVIPRSPMSHPLIRAAEYGSLECLTLFLRKGVAPDFLDENYETPMRQAAGNGHVHIVQRLLCSDPYHFRGAFKLRRPLKIAAARGHLPVLEVLFGYLRAGTSALTIELAAQIILYEGLWHHEREVVHFALQNGADVNNQDPEAAWRFVRDVNPRESAMSRPQKLTQRHKTLQVMVGGIPRIGWFSDIPDALHAAVIGNDRELVDLVLARGFDVVEHGAAALQLALALRNNTLMASLRTAGFIPASYGAFEYLPWVPLGLSLTFMINHLMYLITGTQRN